jgi:uncharacterized protein
MDARELDTLALAAVLDGGPAPLFATVSGAHLYGFASADSDVDLRGAYVKPLDERLTLRPTTDTITVDLHHDGLEVDWVAHDVRKFARLMLKRNGYVLEQLYSPLVVHDGGGWLRRLRDVGRGCLVQALHHHYRGFAATKRRDLARPGATVKDLLYAYRVHLTGIHLLRTGRIEAHLPSLLDEHRIPEGADVESLVLRKQTGHEKAMLAEGELDRHVPILDGLLDRLGEAADGSHLPREPDDATFAALDEIVVAVCRELG